MNSIRFCWLLFSVLCSQLIIAQVAINEIKEKPLGSVVTIEGVITSAGEFGDLRYVQDSTAGIAAFPGENIRDEFSQLKPGDAVQITGVLIEYRGLLEVSPVLSLVRTGEGLPLPEPFIGTFEDVLGKPFHGSRVQVECAVFEDGAGIFQQGKYRLYDQTGTVAEIFLDAGHPILGKSIPESTFTITGISHYEFKEKFQVHGLSSLATSDCLIASPPVVKEIWTDGAAFEWISSDAGYAQYRYGLHPDSLLPGIVLDSLDRHVASVGFIDPATVFYFQPGVTVGETSAWGPVRPFITASAIGGNVEIYFNNDVNEVSGLEPSGTSFSELMDAIFDLIASADKTIDIAMYNINRNDIVNALEVANGRGVRVRYIADADQGNNALDPLPDFPVMFRNGSGIMHNKFIVVDADDPANARVWTGATNFTSNQLSRDPNNAIQIQDQALARVFTMEFDEMWGGEADLPNVSMSRSGEAKYDNTPHVLNIAGVVTEVYFSPSDYVTAAISGFISQASSSIELGLLLITHEGLATTLVDAHERGVDVTGLYNDPEFSGSALNILNNGGVRMYDYVPGSIFHHKYMIVDADVADKAVLLTGSHNWTYSAENINDENTLIIHDAGIAGLYRDEFRSRLSETITSSRDVQKVPAVVSPNPFHDFIEVEASEDINGLQLITADGRVVAESGEQTLKLEHIPCGVYLLEIIYRSGGRSYEKVIRQ